jgi:hypothetical protein
MQLDKLLPESRLSPRFHVFSATYSATYGHHQVHVIIRVNFILYYVIIKPTKAVRPKLLLFKPT